MIFDILKHKEKGNVVYKDGRSIDGAAVIVGRDKYSNPIYLTVNSNKELFEKLGKWLDKKEATDRNGNYYLKQDILDWYNSEKKKSETKKETKPEPKK